MVGGIGSEVFPGRDSRKVIDDAPRAQAVEGAKLRTRRPWRSCCKRDHLLKLRAIEAVQREAPAREPLAGSWLPADVFHDVLLAVVWMTHVSNAS